MTYDELLNKAIEWLRRLESRNQMIEGLREMTVDRLPMRRIRDAVVIDFESDDNNNGSIQVTMERDSGKVISTRQTPPKEKPAAGSA